MLSATQSRWISLVDAVKYIETALSVSSVFAQVALKKKVGTRQIPVKWSDSRGDRDLPDTRKLACSQLILRPPGFAPGTFGPRPLLLLRSAVHRACRDIGKKLATAPTAYPFHAGPWVSLVEAVEYIQIVEGCNAIYGLRQLKDEIGDGLVAIQWKDSDGTHDRPDPKRLEGSQLLLVGPGYAPDLVTEEYRPLMIRWPDLRKLWEAAKASRQEFGALSTTKRKGRRTVRHLILETLEQMRKEKFPMNCHKKR